jgi:2-oxo-4-hydroxy-4-carboxy-5-ureidoimidazoline decarboxylase
VEVTDFNSLAVEDATTLLAGCLGVRRWVDELVAGRPYESAPALRARAHDAARHLTDDELDAALSRHPRIGERPATTGQDAATGTATATATGTGTGTDEARFSRAEQAGVSDEHGQRLRDANAAYEARFGHVFLVRAAGRNGAELLAEAERRLANDDAAEREETVTALRDIALLRLGQVVS